MRFANANGCVVQIDHGALGCNFVFASSPVPGNTQYPMVVRESYGDGDFGGRDGVRRPFSDQFFLNFNRWRGILKPYPNFCIPGGGMSRCLGPDVPAFSVRRRLLE